MSSQERENEEVVRKYLAAFNDQNPESLSEYLAENVVEHGIHDELHGIEEIQTFLDRHFEIFPDYSGTTDAVVVDDDVVTVRYSVSGTHSGTYMGVEPTEQTAEWTGIAMYRVENGLIQEIWLEEDRLGLLEQLEVYDPPAHLRI